jgi:hypothetical protein
MYIMDLSTICRTKESGQRATSLHERRWDLLLFQLALTAPAFGVCRGTSLCCWSCSGTCSLTVLQSHSTTSSLFCHRYPHTPSSLWCRCSSITSVWAARQSLSQTHYLTTQFDCVTELIFSCCAMLSLTLRACVLCILSFSMCMLGLTMLCRSGVFVVYTKALPSFLPSFTDFSGVCKVRAHSDI